MGNKIVGVFDAYPLSDFIHPQVGLAQELLGLLHPELQKIIVKVDTVGFAEQLPQINGVHIEKSRDVFQVHIICIMGVDILFDPFNVSLILLPAE
ncbi:hypothetical protein D3C75_1123740 [compost metagenome]